MATAAESRQVDELRRQVYELQQRIGDLESDHSSRLTALEVKDENRRVREAAAPTWLFGVITALVSLGALIVQLFVQFGGRAP